MIDDVELERIIQDERESPILEFKRQWYWNNSDIDQGTPKKWGEFLKDILGLANGYLEYVGETRYLIIGVEESDKTIYNVDPQNIRILSNLNTFHQKVIQKIENHAKPSLTKIEIYWKEIEQKQILVIEIPSPPKFVELIKELQTKTRILDPGIVLIRKGQEEDSVRAASPDEIKDLEKEFNEYNKNNKNNNQNKPKIRKVRSIQKIVNSLLNMNASLSLVKEDSIKNWETGIVFEVFKTQESWGDIKYFIYIHEDSSQVKTLNYLREESIIDTSSNLIVLTEKPEKLKKPEDRKAKLKSLFKTDKVYFIDEFAYDHLYGKCISDYEPFGVSVFVESYSDSSLSQNVEKTALERLNEWYESTAQPILAVKGYGGIGKTTLLKYFLDTIYKNNKNIGLLFIDSNHIINELNRLVNNDKNIDDIFDFYQALFNSGKYNLSEKFSQELLQLSIDHGRLVIVLDGIDEVIAKLGNNFDIDKFLQNIKSQYFTDLEKSKIIITCRDYFWDRINTDLTIAEISLKPFDQTLAQEFFEKTFKGNKKKITRSMSFAQTFSWNQSDETIYIPYILDMIADSYEEDMESESIEASNISTILKMNSIQEDYIMGSFCNREISKLNNFKVDNQIRLFMELSVTYNGKISVYNIKDLLRKLNIYKSNDDDNYNQAIEKLQGHPILDSNGQEIFFRYDFFKSYFIFVYIGEFFAKRDYNKVIEEESLITLLANYIKFDSVDTRNISNRFEYDEDLIEFGYLTIDKLRESNHNEEIKKKAISAIFVMILVSVRESGNLNIENNTKILKNIFMIENKIRGLCLIDIFKYERVKLTFDFKGLKFKDCYFDNYTFFWDCLVDENTYFTDSTFKSLTHFENIRTILKRKQFSNGCDIKEIQPTLDEIDTNEANRSETLRDELKQFFNLFWERGNFYPRKQEHIKGKQKFHKYIQTLLDSKVIEECNDSRHPKIKLYRICDEYKAITQTIAQGTSCAEFRRVIKLFKSK